jgi:hypothetical protein
MAGGVESIMMVPPWFEGQYVGDFLDVPRGVSKCCK